MTIDKMSIDKMSIDKNDHRQNVHRKSVSRKNVIAPYIPQRTPFLTLIPTANEAQNASMLLGFVQITAVK